MSALLLHGLESAFTWILEASWQASVLAALVLLLQWAFRGKLNPRWHHALWLLVIARLVLPVLPESALSLFQFAPPTPLVVEQTMTTPIFATPPVLPAVAAVTTPAPPAPQYSLSAFTVLALIWLVGALGLLLLTWCVNRRFATHVSSAPAVTDPHLMQLAEAARSELRIRSSLRIIESSQVQSPAIMGLFCPTLILPTDVRGRFSDEELRFILLHEFAHLKRGDLFLQWLVALLQIAHWFNPVLWYAFRRMRIDREPATDALVLSSTGEEQKETYGRVLVKLLRHYHARHALPTLVGILEDKDQFKRRFILIMKFNRGAYGLSLVGVVFIAVLALVCLTKSKATEPANATYQKDLSKTTPTGPTEAEMKAVEDSQTPLIKALLGRQYDQARALLARGADCNATDKMGLCPLGALLDHSGNDGRFPMDLLQTILARTRDPNPPVPLEFCSPPMSTPLLDDALFCATYSNGSDRLGDDRQVVKLLLAHGARFASAPANTQALLQAAALDDLTAMHQLVAKGTSPSAADGDGWSPLLVSSALNYDDAANWLIDHGANVSAPTRRGAEDPLIFATAHANDALVEKLIAKGAKPVRRGGDLWRAVDRNDQRLFDDLINAGADPKGDTQAHGSAGGKYFRQLDLDPLFICIARGQTAMALTLIAKGVDPEPANVLQNRSFAYWAVFHDRPQILKALLDHGANPLLKTDAGETPLSLAQKSHPDLVPMLEAAAKELPQSNTSNQPDPKATSDLHAHLLAAIQKSDAANSVAPETNPAVMIRIAPKVVQIDEDDYEAHRAVIDNAVQRGDVTPLSTLKSYHLLSSPAVLTKSGEQGVLEAVRGLPYPTAFEKEPDGTFKPTDFKRQNLGLRFVVLPTFLNGKINFKGDLNITSLEKWTQTEENAHEPLFHVREALVSELFAFGETKGFEVPGGAQMEPTNPSFYFPPEKVPDASQDPKALRRLFLFLNVQAFHDDGRPMTDRPVENAPAGAPTTTDTLTVRTFLAPAGFFKTTPTDHADIRRELIAHGIAFPANTTAIYVSIGTIDDLAAGKIVVRNTPEQLDKLAALIEAAANEAPISNTSIQPGASFQKVTVGGKLQLVRPKDVDLNKSIGYLQSVDGGSTEFHFQSDGSFVVPNVKPGVYDRRIHFVPTAPEAQTVDMTFAPLTVDGSDAHMTANLNVALKIAAPVKGSIVIGLKVMEISDDVYLANKDKVDAAVEKADIGYFNNLEGVSLLSAPSVSTQPGTRANIDIVREFPYPIKFDPAMRVSNSGGATVTVPVTPTDFATKDVGVRAEITPTINGSNSPDPSKIVLNGKFSVTNFDGFTKSNVIGVSEGMPSFSTNESLFLEQLDDSQEKGLWIPGEHIALKSPTAANSKANWEATAPTVKKRYLLFVSASLVK